MAYRTKKKTHPQTEERGEYKEKNPRWQNGNLRRKYRARFEAMGEPCAICGKPIMYDQPSDSKHPLSLVIDEKIPVSLALQYGYTSKRAAAEDFDNLQPAHWCCNAAKSNKVGFTLRGNAKYTQPIRLDGQW